MARQENDLICCMLTQALQPEYWNWEQDELNLLHTENVQDITEVVVRRLTVAGFEPEEVYAIIHDKDTVLGWDEITKKTVVEYKTHHIYIVVRFKKGRTATLPQIAMTVGLEPQFIEKAKRGRYGYDNMVAYLIHIKDVDKYQYQPEDVYTACGRNYMGVYTLRREEWLKGRAKKKATQAKQDVEWLESKLLIGEVVKSQMLLTDEYYEIYARNKRRCDDALDTYSQRKIYKTIQAMENGEFKTTVYFVTGSSHSGKSLFSETLARSIQQRVFDERGEKWTVCTTASSNPFDEYFGEEILLMDDLRGMALTASDWLKLMDPDRINTGSARYHNRKMACRVVIINSEKDALEFFYYLKNSGGGDRSEAMDQFFRRIMARVVVYRVPPDFGERRLKIGTMTETEPYKLWISAPDGVDALILHHNWENDEYHSDMEYDEAVEYLTDIAMEMNHIAVPERSKKPESIQRQLEAKKAVEEYNKGCK